MPPRQPNVDELLRKGELLKEYMHAFLAALNYSEAQLLKKMFKDHAIQDVALKISDAALFGLRSRPVMRTEGIAAAVRKNALLSADIWSFMTSIDTSQWQLLVLMFSNHHIQDVAQLLCRKVLWSIQTHNRPARTR